MGKHLIMYALLGAALMTGCSPDIGEAHGKSLSHREFIGLLMDYHPQYFNKKRAFVEGKLHDWKRLKVALEDYLADEAIYMDLVKSGFPDSINPKRKALFRLITLGVYSRLNTAKRTSLESLMKSEKAIWYKPLLPLNLDMKKDPAVLRVKGHITLTQRDLMDIFPGKTIGELTKIMTDNVLPNMYFALEGIRLGLDEDSVFKRYWVMRWRFYTIKEYRQKKRKDLVKAILADNSQRLRQYFDRHKNRYVIYKKKAEAKEEEREKYQYSFIRLRESVAKDLSEGDMKRWKMELMEKHGFKVNESYFKDLGNKEINKLKAK